MEAEIDSMAGTFTRKMASSSKQNVTTNLNIQEIVQAVVNNLIALPAPLPTTSEGSTNSTNETVSIELNRSFQILRGGVSRSQASGPQQLCTQQIQSIVLGFNAQSNYSTRPSPRARRQNLFGSGRFQPYLPSRNA